ncbi:ergothioneine biosynthesis protein EgtB [Marinigracilibium pacificum]|uniref:Ergothioneine biosynthesis protein EgtB n=1 Tax=Marinigracilibium pacificum TaxID=2729599 RepID=A0A848IUP5_9BACT|nr:ergothioneine biosynthesis protein EgtB [Marinigracilibium pacificum]NMM48223.1 ergothioneine biosynthesis protein EgtB [Marinigracilibium pacificum]
MHSQSIINPAAESLLSLTDRYNSVREKSVELSRPLNKEDFVVQPVEFVSPTKWHLAHTTWFFEEFLLVPLLADYKRFHPDFAFLFNSYYEAVGERMIRSERGNITRPGVELIFDYRKYVDDRMQVLLKNFPDDKVELLEIGLNHEQQHQELLLTDIKYVLGHNPLFPPYSPQFDESARFSNGTDFIKIEEGLYTIGHDGNGFGYDNEFPQHKVFLNSYEISNSLVTNSEYLEFIDSGGYENHEWWYSDAWAYLQESGIKKPLYWHKKNENWYRYSMKGLEVLNPDEPVTHVSHYEAAAFAEWKKMRLPTEFEWEVAADQFDWGWRWEHTGSAYRPYPGYKKADGAIGEYNGKFMINQMVLKGASIATSPGHARKTYRNFFHPELQWQFTGIRLCK